MFIGNEIFKTIVEMSYEMAYHDQCEKEIKNAVALFPTFIDTLQSNRNRKALRKLDRYLETKDEKYRSVPWKYNGRLYVHTLYQEYERYRNPQNKVRERGEITITVSERTKDGKIYDIRHMYSRVIYENDTEFPLCKEELKRKYKEMFSYNRSIVKCLMGGR